MRFFQSLARLSSVLWSILFTVLACVGAWFFAVQVHEVGMIPSAASPSSLSSLPLIVSEADVTSTEPFVEEAGVPMSSLKLLPSPHPSSSTTIEGLTRPDLPLMKRLAGDPRSQKGERIIRVPVFMYHKIRSLRATDTARERAFIVTPETFERQLQDLVQEGFVGVTPAELEAALLQGEPLPSKPVLLTFDDGFREHYTTVFPLLKKYQFKATYFVITNAHRLSGYLTEPMLQELDESGLVTIASHTEQHPYLARLSSAARIKEIEGSKQHLEVLLGHPVKVFAYPYGSWSLQVAKEVEAAGYVLGFGVRLGSRHTPSHRYQLRRIRVLEGERLSAYAGEL